MKQYELIDWSKQVLSRPIYDAAVISEAINEKFNTFEQIRIFNTLKKVIDVSKFHLINKPRMFIFGAGGTTSWFLPKVLKIFNDIFNKRRDLRYNFEIILVDADELSLKNIIRQNFIHEDVGQNKAQILSERYTDLYPNIKVSYVDKYGYYSNDKLEASKTEEELHHFINIQDLAINRKDILVNLVDNEGFKKQLDAWISDSGQKGLYFSSGLNLFNGQVYYNCSNSDLSNPYTIDHPDLFTDFEEVSVHACADADANGTDDNPEQMFNGNDLAASFLANLLQTILSEVVDYQRVNFISGANISCQKQGKYYGLILQYLDFIDLDIERLPTEYKAAIRYVDKYGMNQNTSKSKMHYELNNQINNLTSFHNFLKTLNIELES